MRTHGLRNKEREREAWQILIGFIDVIRQLKRENNQNVLIRECKENASQKASARKWMSFVLTICNYDPSGAEQDDEKLHRKARSLK